MMIAPVACPFCHSAALSITTRQGETRANVSCRCGATGPIASHNETAGSGLPFDQSAIIEWNIWAEARRMHNERI